MPQWWLFLHFLASRCMRSPDDSRAVVHLTLMTGATRMPTAHFRSSPGSPTSVICQYGSESLSEYSAYKMSREMLSEGQPPPRVVEFKLAKS